MSRLLSSLALLSLLVAVAACGGSREALLTPAERATYAATNTVALAPVNLVASERPDELTAAADYIERVLTQRLERSGFTVIPPAQSWGVYDTLALDTQNKYNPGTGEPNPAVMPGLKAAFARQMAVRHGADAVLFPEVLLVRADIEGSTAKWDGVQEPVPVDLQNETAASESNRPDALAALSLAVELIGRTGESLYTSQGGMEYLGPLKRSQETPVLFRGPFEKEGLFQQTVRVERAVLLSLDVLARKKAAAGIGEDAL